MVATMSLIRMFMALIWGIIILLLIFSKWMVWLYIITWLLIFILIFRIVLYPLELWWHCKWDIWNMIWSNFRTMIFTMLAYSFIYYKFSLFTINWIEQNITFIESIYFSLSMWVDLWYSYILPWKDIALITSIEAVNWYIYFAFIIAMLSFRFNYAINSSTEYKNNLWKIEIKEVKKNKTNKKKKWKQ